MSVSFDYQDLALHHRQRDRAAAALTLLEETLGGTAGAQVIVCVGWLVGCGVCVFFL